MCQSQKDNSKSWFSPSIEYSGTGKAYFENPKGYVEGNVRVSIDDSCHSHIEMEIERVESEEEITFGLVEFLSNERPYKKENRLTFSGVDSLGENPCTKLEVNCSDGIFTTFEQVIYNPVINLIGGGNIKFYIPTSQLSIQVDKRSKFWVIPLINYVGKFQEIDHNLVQHPLRLRETPYPLITFEYHGKKGFIEPLLDIEKRREELLTGKSQRLITAIMVGEVCDEEIDADNYQEKLPLEFLTLLNLATGSEVSMAWVELRSSDGELVTRLHGNFHKPCFSKGHQVIPEISPDGSRDALKYLLTQSQSSPYFGRAPLGPVIADLVESGFNIISISDTLNRLCRGFDHLCKHFNFDRQNLMNELDSSNQNIVKSHLLDTAQAIRKLANNSNDTEQSQVLRRIADKVVNSANVDRNFGLSVVDLMRQFELPDVTIIDDFYAVHPRQDGRESWSSVISYYRGMSVHVGYFESGSEPDQYDVQDLVRIILHLQDILTRIVLKMLNYDGVYYPSIVMRQRAAMPVDWVQPSTSASELGY